MGSSTNLTISTSLNFNSTATAGSRRLLFYSATYGTAYTLTLNGSISVLEDVDFRDITFAGSGSWTTGVGSRIGNCGGNSGSSTPISAAKTVYLRAGTNSNWSDAIFSNTSNGSADTLWFALPQDTARRRREYRQGRIIHQARSGVRRGATKFAA